MKGTLAIVAALLVAGVVAQECNKNSCSECIRIPNCMWCAKPGNLTDDEGNNLSRCKRIQSEFSDVWREACTDEFINQPANYFELVKNEELTKESVFVESEAGYEKASVVQIRPQQVKLNLRVQEDLELETFYKQALDYPVDLYYLMDLSKSMEDDKKSLSQLGQQLADEMQNITRNFRLGFGSFVDKVVMPYVSTVPSKLTEPCSGCRAPYGFKNALPLNTNASRFTEEVREAQVSGNLDAPEGGFDAIMQAIVCQEDINWRQNARRLLVFSTDAGFHYAGDGKLGGIVKPNDGQCHLEKGEYTHSTLQDYPSVSQINQVAKTHKINLIFAVTAELTSVYSRLAKMVEGSYHGELTSDSSNVVQLVKDQYEAITSKVELKDNATYPLSITYYSKCLGDEVKKTSVCEGLRVGDTVSFMLKFRLEECPADERDWIQKIGIYPVGIQETLIIDLKMLCSCNCESPGDPGYIANAEQCDFHGTYKCGVCDCDDGYFGRKCECGAETPWGTAGNIDNSGCFETPNSTMCTGRGTCYCGECDCNERDNPEEEITGDFCECTNFQCSRQHGQLCSGPDHGRCVCNKCICEPGWKGDDCSCEDSTDQCYDPDDPSKECSGNGKCKCNKCDCFELEEGRFSGKWCEDCPTCKGKCQEYKACVQCLVFQTGELDEEDCLKNCTFFNVTEVPIAKVEQEGDKHCTFYDENDCRFTFVYGYKNGEPVVRVQQTLECPPKLDILGIVLGVIGAIVAVGLALLLMWKVLTTIHDRREFARFEKERMMAKWDTGENPIYKQATSTFKNPIYGGK